MEKNPLKSEFAKGIIYIFYENKGIDKTRNSRRDISSYLRK